MEEAAQLLSKFNSYWNACKGNEERQQQLIARIVERVYVKDNVLVAMTLKPTFHVVLGNNTKEPMVFAIDSSVHVRERRASIPNTYDKTASSRGRTVILSPTLPSEWPDVFKQNKHIVALLTLKNQLDES